MHSLQVWEMRQLMEKQQESMKVIDEIRVFYTDGTLETFTATQFFRRFARVILKAVEGLGHA